MDGQIRRRAVIKLLPFIMIVHGSPVIANDSENPKHRDVKMYMSPRLEKEFLGAVSVDLRFEESNGQPQRCKLKLFSHSDTSANGLKSTTVAITLKEVSPSAESTPRDAYDQGYITYNVSGLPSEVLKSGDALQLRLAAKGGGDEETAQLLQCGRDGKPSRRIELTLAVIPDEAETIGPEKGQTL
jgi:hypothetical protein